MIIQGAAPWTLTLSLEPWRTSNLFLYFGHFGSHHLGDASLFFGAAQWATVLHRVIGIGGIAQRLKVHAPE